MAVTMMRQDLIESSIDDATSVDPCVIHELGRADEQEVIDFLSVRPIHTVFMAGLIRDNGLLSPRNRGSFYGARNQTGQLQGVALIGHAILVEAHGDVSRAAFARVARNCRDAHLIRGERKATNAFWKHYTGAPPRQICRELLVHRREVPQCPEDVSELRLATIDDLEKVLAVNSSMAFEEGGIRPLERDPSGFRNRTAQRIGQGRVWVWVDGNRLIFKADIVSQTPQVTYLEGVYVHPEERGKGYGRRCINRLSARLLSGSNTICLTVNNRNKRAVAFYSKAGFQFHSHYETIYLR